MPTDNVSQAVQEIFDRLKFHTKDGELLHGLRWTAIPTTELSGEKDLPDLRPAGSANSEAYRPGDVAVPSLTLRLILATKISEGYPANLHWAAKVQDAIETKVDGTLSPGLSGLLAKPVTFVVESNSAVGQAFVSSITISLMPKPAMRGARVTT